MMETRYIAPTLGVWSSSILGLTVLGAILLITSPASDGAMSATWSHRHLAATGVILGLALAGCWVATAVDSPFWRLLTRISLVAVLAGFQTQLNGASWLRSSSTLGGLLASQCILFAWFRVPAWRSWRHRPNHSSHAYAQFSIGDLIGATTATALLLAVATRYQSPIDPHSYWMVLVVFWLVMPVVAADIATALLLRDQPIRCSLYLTVAAVLALGSAVGLGAAQGYLATDGATKVSLSEVKLRSMMYAEILLSGAATFLIAAIAARIQPNPSAAQPTEELADRAGVA